MIIIILLNFSKCSLKYEMMGITSTASTESCFFVEDPLDLFNFFGLSVLKVFEFFAFFTLKLLQHVFFVFFFVFNLLLVLIF